MYVTDNHYIFSALYIHSIRKPYGFLPPFAPVLLPLILILLWMDSCYVSQAVQISRNETKVDDFRKLDRNQDSLEICETSSYLPKIFTSLISGRRDIQLHRHVPVVAFQSPCHPPVSFSPYWNVLVTYFKVYTSLPRHPSSLYPFVLFTTWTILPLPWLFSLYSPSISCFPLYSLTLWAILHSLIDALAMSSLLWFSLLSLIHNKNLILTCTIKRSFQWFPYSFPCIQGRTPKIWCQLFY